MSKCRKLESAEQRNERFLQEARMKRDAAKAQEAAVDRMVRWSIEKFGP